MDMEALSYLVYVCTLFAVPGIVISALILFFGRKRIGWARWELVALVAPYAIWIVLMLSPLVVGRKSLANLVEPLNISAAMPAVALLRVALGRNLSEKIHAAICITLLCAVAVATFFLVPSLPE